MLFFAYNCFTLIVFLDCKSPVFFIIHNIQPTLTSGYSFGTLSLEETEVFIS